MLFKSAIFALMLSLTFHAHGAQTPRDLFNSMNDLLGEIDPDFPQYDLETARDKVYQCFLSGYHCITSAYNRIGPQGQEQTVVKSRFTPSNEQISRAQTLEAQYQAFQSKTNVSPAARLLGRMNDLLAEVKNSNFRQYDLQSARSWMVKCFINQKCVIRTEYSFGGWFAHEVTFKPSASQVRKAQELLDLYNKL